MYPNFYFVYEMKNCKFIYLAFSFLLTSAVIGQNNRKIDSLKNLIKLSKEDTNRVMYLDQLAYEYSSRLEYDTLYKYSTQGLQLARKLNYKPGIIGHLKNSGDYFVRRGNHTKALSLVLEAYKIAMETDLKRESLQTLSAASSIYSSYNNYKEAIKYKILELKTREEVLSDTNYRKLSTNLSADSTRVSIAFGGLGYFYAQTNQLDSALYYAKKSLAYGEKIQKKDASIKSYALNCLATAYLKKGNTDSAMYYFKSGAEYALLSKKKQTKLVNLNKSYLEIAKLFRSQNQIDSSIHYAELALPLCQEINTTKDEIEIQFLLAQNYSGKNDALAVKYFKGSSELRDSLYNKEKAQQLESITFNEQERQKEVEKQRKLAEEKRKTQINYLIIGTAILLFIICFIALSSSIITSEKVNTYLAALAIMMIFKFSNMIIDPYLEFEISDNPAITFFTAIATASILSPVQKPIKKWLKDRMLAKAKARDEKAGIATKKKKTKKKKTDTEIEEPED